MQAKEMVGKIEEFLATNIGTGRINVDGTDIIFDRKQAMLELEYWKRQAAREQGKRNIFRGFNLNTAW